MRTRIEHDLQTQLNAWVVTRFIDSIYNMNHINKLPEFLSDTCRFCHENKVVGESLSDLQVHFVYTWINQQHIFDQVQYGIEELISSHDIVSVKLRRHGVRSSSQDIPEDTSRWEMFQLTNGKIVRRWTANA